MSRYYVSPVGTVRVSQIVNKLSDFTGVEGKKYTVRKRKKVDTCDMLDTYEYREGKLHKNNEFHCLWI